MRHLETLQRVMTGDYQNASPEDREEAVKDVIQVCSVSSAAAAIQPIPFLDTALLAPIQIGLVQAIGRVHGYSLDKKAVLEILASFGAGLIAQNAVLAALKFVPIVGWILGPSVAFALTYAIGQVADAYFASGRTLHASELQSQFKRVYESTRKEKQDAHRGDGTLKSKLEQLKEARKNGILTEEEFEAKKAQILEDF